MTTRWIITGSQGQLGRALVANIGADPGCELVASPDHGALDIASAEAVERFFAALSEKPDFVVNAAAYTKVDSCETEGDLAHAVNTVAPGVLAEACRGIGASLVHVSTDYVFPGECARPYSTADPTGPVSAYGRSKLGGEQRVLGIAADSLVVRTSWVFGDGHNFIRAILRQVGLRRTGRITGPLSVVDDQRGRPTYAVDLAQGLIDLATAGATGLFHLANDGEATWWDLARFCVDAAGAPDVEIERGRTADLGLKAARPSYAVLDCSRSAEYGVVLRHWQEAVRAYLDSDVSPLSEVSSPS